MKGVYSLHPCYSYFFKAADMKHFLFTGLLLVAGYQSTAEHRFHFGIRTNVCISDISLTMIKDDRYHNNEATSSKSGFCGGLFVEVPLFKYASVQIEGLSSSAGFNHYYTDFGEQSHTYKLQYYSVPLILKARFKGIALLGGFQRSWLKSAVLDKHGGYSTAPTNIAKDQQKTEWALVSGIEYTAPFGLGVNIRYQYGLTNMAVGNSDTYVITDDIRNQIIQFGLYYRFLK